MQNLRHPQFGSAALGDKYGKFRINSTDYCLISEIFGSGTFSFVTGFSLSSNVTALFLIC